jgi:hypothetical protein
VTGQWEQYVEAAVAELELYPPDVERVVAFVGPLIAEGTRVRMVEAAVEIMEREGVEDTRAAIISDLRWLAEARKEYCQRCPEHQGDMHDMGPTALAVHDDHDAAERLADIIEGTNEAKGWLPSWRWDEWRSRQA